MIFQESQKGFMPLFILGAVAVVLLAGSGWYAFQKQKFGIEEIEKTVGRQVEKLSGFGVLLEQNGEVTNDKPLNESLDENGQGEKKETAVLPSATPTVTNVPVKKGSIRGKVEGGYNSQSLTGVKITITGEGVTKSVNSGGDGSFLINDLPVGKYTLSAFHSDYDFSDSYQEIKEGENVLGRIIHGFLKNPQPLLVSGQAFEDRNGNNVKDGDEPGVKIFLSLYLKTGDEWGKTKTIDTDDQGNFAFQESWTGNYKLEPAGMTFYNKPGAVEFTVDGYGGSKTYNFPYYPLSSQSGFKVLVFNDRNENGSQDAGEEYVHYQNLQVTNTSTGTSWRTGVGENGFEKKPAEYGFYNFELVPDGESWAAYYKITKGRGDLTVTNTSGTGTLILGAHKLY